MENKKYFITGVSTVDPFTAVQYIVKDKSNNNQIVKTINSKISSELYIDGSMLNILRKYLNENREFTNIYIYLTEEMNAYKDVYIKAIKHLYNNKNVNIKFYPNDFIKDYETKLRKQDVHKFSSYYKEIYDIYLDIKKECNEERPEIILNIASGTPAFKADMMLIAVTNNLIIEQTANLTSDNTNKLRNYALKNDEEYKNMEKEISNNPNLYVDIVSNSRYLDFKNVADNEFLIMMDKLKNTEENVDTRTQTEDISQTKKIMLLESIENSISKNDYAGIYYSISENKGYLSKNKEQLLEIAKNLYYRFIGSNERDYDINNIENLKKYYPIFNIKFDNDAKKNFNEQKKLNYIIEKFNIMKVKSKREEINDFLLISTPLVEAISKEIAQRYSGINFETILAINNKKENVISFKQFENIYGNKVSTNLKETVKENDNSHLNEYFYKNILFALKNDMVYQKKPEIEKILDRIYIIDMARADRVDAAHSIKNVNKEEFEKDYTNRIKQHKRYENRLKFIIENLKKLEKNYSNIHLIEMQFKELIQNLLPIGANSKIFEDSLNIYDFLGNKILELLKDEIYKI